MPDPLVSVVVPSRGGASRLPVLIEALVRQDFEPEWEVVVVLDGDVDASREVLGSLSDRVPLRVIEFPENRGRSAALNEGFSGARGDVLVRCDDDLVPDTDYLRRHAAHHEGSPAGVVGLYRNVFPDTTYARVYGRGWDRAFRAGAYAVPAEQAWRYWAGNCSVTRDTWQRIGPYDTDFRAYGFEDVDWGYRLARAGIPIHLDRELETEHRIAATTTAGRAQRAYYSGAARQRFDHKHGLDERPARPSGTWGRLVSGLASRLDESRAVRLGRTTDRIAGLLPAPVAEKAVALVVESSSRAGHVAGAASGAI